MKRFFTLLSADGNRTDQAGLHEAVIRTEIPFHIQPLFSPHPVMNYLRGESPFDNRKIYPFPTLILCDDGLERSRDDPEATGEGWGVLANIRAISSCANLPIIMLGESQTHHPLSDWYEPGACHFLHKPTSAAGWGGLVEGLYTCVAGDPLVTAAQARNATSTASVDANLQ
jgi:CheY-like chemotaxis protein